MTQTNKNRYSNTQREKSMWMSPPWPRNTLSATAALCLVVVVFLCGFCRENVVVTAAFVPITSSPLAIGEQRLGRGSTRTPTRTISHWATVEQHHPEAPQTTATTTSSKVSSPFEITIPTTTAVTPLTTAPPLTYQDRANGHQQGPPLRRPLLEHPLLRKLKLQRRKHQQQQEQQQQDESTAAATTTTDLDAMRARANVLRRSIVQQQLELQQLERQIICCAAAASSSSSSLSSNGTLSSSSSSSSSFLSLLWKRSLTTFQSSTNVLLRKLHRVRGAVGVNNQQWKGSVRQFVVAQTSSGVRIVDRLLQNNQTQLWMRQLLVDPDSPSLVPHVPAILARLDRLEDHVAPILEKVLLHNHHHRHLASIEPYLDEIMERFDDIEPHLPWILEHIDILAPYTGLLLKHIDELLPYAQLDKSEFNDGDMMLKANATHKNHYQYALAEQLLPYLEFYVSRLDIVGPHLPLLRPHVPKLLKHNRIGKMTPHIDKLFALGYKDNLGASANMDVLLFWFGWALRVPGLPRLFFAIPGSPRMVTFLANRLPKRFVRGLCSGISCTVDGDYGDSWNKLSK